MSRSSSALKVTGHRAEDAFRTWLDQSGMPYHSVDQFRLNVPPSLLGKIELPDYIVGMPFIGSIAFSVKTDAVVDHHFLLDPHEIEKLARYGAHFHTTVYFACFDPSDLAGFRWISLRDLQNYAVEQRDITLAIPFPIADAFEVSFSESILDAYMRLCPEL